MILNENILVIVKLALYSRLILTWNNFFYLLQETKWNFFPRNNRAIIVQKETKHKVKKLGKKTRLHELHDSNKGNYFLSAFVEMLSQALFIWGVCPRSHDWTAVMNHKLFPPKENPAVFHIIKETWDCRLTEPGSWLVCFQITFFKQWNSWAQTTH